MSRIITFFLLFVSVFVVHGASQRETVKIDFPLNQSTFNPALNNNAISMDRFIDTLVVNERIGNVDNLVVYGYASPDGPFNTNYRLSLQRCREIANLISRLTCIPLDSIRTEHSGVAWDILRNLVAENPDTPSQAIVLKILDQYLPAACSDAEISNQCRDNLMAIDNGRVYRWMLENLFPDLRFVLATYTHSTSDTSLPEIDNEKFLTASELIANGNTMQENTPEDTLISESENIVESSGDTLLYQSESITESIGATPDEASTGNTKITSSNFNSNTQRIKPLHKLALKTNLLYDAIGALNLELEWLINKNWTVALEGIGAAVGKYDNGHLCYRLAVFTPEVKRWIKPRAPWHGFYAGLFAGGGLYDYEKSTKGYRGEGAMCGVSLGFMWPISRCFSMETAIGAGYMFTRYKQYVPLDGHHVYQLTKDLNYFGPLKLKLSLVWRLWDVNKSRSQKLKTEVQYEK